MIDKTLKTIIFILCLLIVGLFSYQILATVISTDDFVTITGIQMGDRSFKTDMRIKRNSYAESWNFSDGNFTVTNPQSFKFRFPSSQVNSVKIIKNGIVVQCSVNNYQSSDYISIENEYQSGTYKIVPFYSNDCREDEDFCPYVPYAVSYNPYPQCGANACVSGYRVINGECVVDSDDPDIDGRKIFASDFLHGELVKTPYHPAVYLIDSRGKRHLFSNEAVFWTWFSGDWRHIKFGNTTKELQIISQSNFDNTPLSENIIARPGANLLKFKGSSHTYVVSDNVSEYGKPIIHRVANRTAGNYFFGPDGARKAILIQHAFENDYLKSYDYLNAGDKLSDGSLIRYNSTNDIYYIDDGYKRYVSAQNFIYNNFKYTSVVNVPTQMTFPSAGSLVGLKP